MNKIATIVLVVCVMMSQFPFNTSAEAFDSYNIKITSPENYSFHSDNSNIKVTAQLSKRPKSKYTQVVFSYISEHQACATSGICGEEFFRNEASPSKTEYKSSLRLSKLFDQDTTYAIYAYLVNKDNQSIIAVDIIQIIIGDPAKIKLSSNGNDFVVANSGDDVTIDILTKSKSNKHKMILTILPSGAGCANPVCGEIVRTYYPVPNKTSFTFNVPDNAYDWYMTYSIIGFIVNERGDMVASDQVILSVTPTNPFKSNIIGISYR